MLLPQIPSVPRAVAADAAAAVACVHAHPRVLLIADLLAPPSSPRLIVIDLRGATPRVILRTQVAQGRGGWSNRPGSLASSAGLYRVAGRYAGEHGTAWRLDGLTPGWNSNARTRDIVLHAAHYVMPGWAGRSWGCPAVSRAALTALTPWLPPRGRGVFLFVAGPGIGHAAPLQCAAGRAALAAPTASN